MGPARNLIKQKGEGQLLLQDRQTYLLWTKVHTKDDGAKSLWLKSHKDQGTLSLETVCAQPAGRSWGRDGEGFSARCVLIFCVCEETAGLISKRLFMGAFALFFTPSPQLTVSAACCSSHASPEACGMWGVPAPAPLLLLPPNTDPIAVLLPEAGSQPTCKSSVGLFFHVSFSNTQSLLLPSWACEGMLLGLERTFGSSLFSLSLTDLTEHISTSASCFKTDMRLAVAHGCQPVSPWVLVVLCFQMGAPPLVTWHHPRGLEILGSLYG